MKPEDVWEALSARGVVVDMTIHHGDRVVYKLIYDQISVQVALRDIIGRLRTLGAQFRGWDQPKKAEAFDTAREIVAGVNTCAAEVFYPWPSIAAGVVSKCRLAKWEITANTLSVKWSEFEGAS